MVRSAKQKVPTINPNCTAEVKCPTAENSKLKALTRSFMMPFPANQSDVQKNCEITIIGKINFECFIIAKLKELLCRHNLIPYFCRHAKCAQKIHSRNGNSKGFGALGS